jgi:hypothetical protein
MTAQKTGLAGLFLVMGLLNNNLVNKFPVTLTRLVNVTGK